MAAITRKTSSFAGLHDESDLRTDDDLIERYKWAFRKRKIAHVEEFGQKGGAKLNPSLC